MKELRKDMDKAVERSKMSDADMYAAQWASIAYQTDVYNKDGYKLDWRDDEQWRQAYCDAPDTPLLQARMDMPKYWFISNRGRIVSLYANKATWLTPSHRHHGDNYGIPYYTINTPSISKKISYYTIVYIVFYDRYDISRSPVADWMEERLTEDGLIALENGGIEIDHVTGQHLKEYDAEGNLRWNAIAVNCRQIQATTNAANNAYKRLDRADANDPLAMIEALGDKTKSGATISQILEREADSEDGIIIATGKIDGDGRITNQTHETHGLSADGAETVGLWFTMAANNANTIWTTLRQRDIATGDLDDDGDPTTGWLYNDKYIKPAVLVNKDMAAVAYGFGVRPTDGTGKPSLIQIPSDLAEQWADCFDGNRVRPKRLFARVISNDLDYLGDRPELSLYTIHRPVAI